MPILKFVFVLHWQNQNFPRLVIALSLRTSLILLASLRVIFVLLAFQARRISDLKLKCRNNKNVH